eukprot:7782510-Alexandrium_andersonii.AAC.1
MPQRHAVGRRISGRVAPSCGGRALSRLPACIHAAGHRASRRTRVCFVLPHQAVATSICGCSVVA